MGRIQHGIYVIVHALSGRVRYVGQSDDIDQRLYVHRREGRYNPSTDVVVRQMVHDKAIRDNVEASLIRRLDPTQNSHREWNYGIISRLIAPGIVSEVEEKLQVLQMTSKE